MMCSLIATISPFRRSISAHSRAFSSSAVAIRPPPARRVRPVWTRSDGTPWPSGGTSAVGRERAAEASATAPRVGYTRSCGRHVRARGDAWHSAGSRCSWQPTAVRPARAAVEAAIVFPWPPGSTGHGLVARHTPVLTDATPAVWEALLEVGRAEAHRAEQRLRRRWPDADVVVTDAPPVPGILARARKLRARAIVLGSRGLGAVGRLLLGSVSRTVVRQAPCAVLVVRGSARAPRRFLIGVDGSPHARDAVAFVAGLTPPRGGQARLLSVVEPVRLPSTGLMPARVRALVDQRGGEPRAGARRRGAATARSCARRDSRERGGA